MDRLGWGLGLMEGSAEMQAPECGGRCCALSQRHTQYCARLSGHGASGTATERAGMVFGMAQAADLDSALGFTQLQLPLASCCTPDSIPSNEKGHCLVSSRSC